MTLLDLLYSVEPRRALAIIIGASIVLYALVANLAWLTRNRRTGRIGRFMSWSSTSRIAHSLGELARWVYYLVVPWATLMLGYSTAHALGVWGMDWLNGVIYFAVLAVGAGIVILWVWRPYTQNEHLRTIDESGWTRARHIIEITYQEAHWAFYRSGPILWLGDFYWGSFLGLALVLIEGWSNPTVRASAHDIARADAPLWSGSLAIISTIVFIFTQNVWYCLAVHLLLDLGLRGITGFPHQIQSD